MNFLALSVFMMIVTIIPRILPGFLLDKVKLSPKAKKFLNLIPFTAMAALIFPSVLYIDALGRMWIGALGAIIAIGLSLIKKMPTALVVVLSVLALVGVYALI
jgi:branched-subunit amino acid transport protein